MPAAPSALELAVRKNLAGKARDGTLAADEKALLRALALLECPSPLAVLAAAAGLSPESVLVASDALEARELVHRSLSREERE